MVDSIYGRDYQVIRALTLALAVLVSLVFLITDLVQAMLDPRVSRCELKTLAGDHPIADRPTHHCAGRAAPVMLLVFVLCALLPRRPCAHTSPNTLDYTALLHPPSAAHPFGTEISGATCCRA